MVGRPAGALICAFLAATLTSACSPTDHRVVLKELRQQLAQQYHECVPLGWNPVPASGTYYPGSSVVLQEQGVWLPAMWIARVPSQARTRPDVRAISEVLDELVRAKMLARTPVSGGFQYQLTERALPYFYQDNEFGNNTEAWPYLCYSKIVPQRVVSNEAVHVERLRGDGREAEVFRATFEWSTTPAAPWANDPVIRSHGVILAPLGNPLSAQFVKYGHDWEIARVYSSGQAAPRLVGPSKWPVSGAGSTGSR